MIGVVVGALVRDGRVLLAHRRPDKRAYPDVWDLPGGVMEDGESELGTASHLCRVTGGHDDLAWFGLDELPPPAHVGVRAALLDALRR